jgi:hypothetical protein
MMPANYAARCGRITGATAFLRRSRMTLFAFDIQQDWFWTDLTLCLFIVVPLLLAYAAIFGILVFATSRRTRRRTTREALAEAAAEQRAAADGGAKGEMRLRGGSRPALKGMGYEPKPRERG